MERREKGGKKERGGGSKERGKGRREGRTVREGWREEVRVHSKQMRILTLCEFEVGY